MRDTGDLPRNKDNGVQQSFYAPANVASAIAKCIKDNFEGHGGKSKWFVEAAQRDLRARGLPDGSEKVSARELLMRRLAEIANALPDAELEAKLEEMTSTSLAIAGAGK